MRFWLSPAFCDTAHLVGLARAAEEHGYEGIAIPDHLFHPVELSAPYPYTPDGSRYWTAQTHWPDPWVAIAAMAAVTTRLRFTTNIYVAPARDLLTVAKSVGTAAYLSQDRDGHHRIALGVGPGWCRDEFEATGQPFERRGARLDEMLEALRALWTGEVVDISGPHYTLPKASISPTPLDPVPVYVGGESPVALRRAACADGWIGIYYSLEAAEDVLGRLLAARKRAGTSDRPFRAMLSPLATPDAEVCARLAGWGATDILCAPWMTSVKAMTPPGPSLTEMVESVARYADRFVH